MNITVLAIVELVEVAVGVREHHDHLERILNLFIFEKVVYKHAPCQFLMEIMVLAVLAKVELVEVAVGVREHHDHLGTILNPFIFER